LQVVISQPDGTAVAAFKADFAYIMSTQAQTVVPLSLSPCPYNQINSTSYKALKTPKAQVT
jgi:hypothetical protein